MAARSSDGKLQELLGNLKADSVEALDQLMDAYEERRAERANRPKAILRYVTPPTAEQLGQIRDFLRKKYENEELPLELVEDKSLLGGFCITVGSEEYDWSMKGRLTQMKNRLTQTPQMLSDSSEVIDLLRTEIDAAAFDGKDHEVGEILRVGDGVATVNGLRHAGYGEIVQFESGVKGMVQDIRKEETGIILLGSERGLLAGGRVVRTERRAGVPVGEHKYEVTAVYGDVESADSETATVKVENQKLSTPTNLFAQQHGHSAAYMEWNNPKLRSAHILQPRQRQPRDIRSVVRRRELRDSHRFRRSYAQRIQGTEAHIRRFLPDGGSGRLDYQPLHTQHRR